MIADALAEMPGNRSHLWTSTEVAALEGASEGCRATYLALRGHCYGTRDVCWPTVRRLAEMIGTSSRTVQRALRWLEDRGLVETRQRRVSRTWNTSSLYRLPMIALRAGAKLRDRLRSAFEGRVTQDPDTPCHPERPSGGRKGKAASGFGKIIGGMRAESEHEHGPTSTGLQRW